MKSVKVLLGVALFFSAKIAAHAGQLFIERMPEKNREGIQEDSLQELLKKVSPTDFLRHYEKDSNMSFRD